MLIFKKNIYTKFSALFLIFFMFVNQAQADLVSSDSAKIQVDDAGNVLAVWNAIDDTSFNYLIRSAFFDASTGTWSTPITISDAATSSSVPLIRLNASTGNATCVWGAVDYNTGITMVVAANFDGTTQLWDLPQMISESTEQTLNDYQVVITPTTDATLITWSSYLESAVTTVIRSSYTTTFGGTWSTPVTIGQ